MKYVIAALIFLFLILVVRIIFSGFAFAAYALSLASDPKKADAFCHIMETYTDCSIRSMEAKKKYEPTTQKKSSRPSPHKPWQLLTLLLKTIVTAIISTITKNLVERFLG